LFKKKKILVAGGTGLVGQPLVDKLIKLGGLVYVASLDNKSLVNKNVKKFFKLNLAELKNCIKVTKSMDIVFNLLGVTGSPKTNIEFPASFFMSNLYCAINLLEASKINKVKKYLYTSTYGVYAPSPLSKEDSVWKTFPSEHDKYAGWAKRMGELQVEAFQKQYDFMDIYIVRPANIYGPFANFNPINSMVVSSLLRRVISFENPLIIWGDGSNIRDFIYSEDVAEGMIQVLKKNIKTPINLGSGKGYSIKQLIETILKDKQIKFKPKIIWDKSKPSGDSKRILDTKKAKRFKILPVHSLKEGINKTISWYIKNCKKIDKLRHNEFKKYRNDYL
jgi:GDP-L-fucose synthase